MKPTIYLFQGLVVSVALLWSALACGQGSLAITFDGPPYQPPGSIYGVTSYYESGMYFYPLPGIDAQFGRAWTNLGAAWPNDGTPFIITGAGDSLGFDFTNGSSFGLSSVDLASFSTGITNYTVEFIGYRPDGSTITATFSGTGVNFQTYDFGPGWSSDLTRVEIPDNTWSLDNLVVVVPEPGTGSLSVYGVLMFSFWQIRRRKKL